jgi:signal recognition particle receptor subunit beta
LFISLATDADRTLYFDFLPLNVGTIKGFATKFQLYTVPGQVYYNATRKLVLRGVDGIVFVADSQVEKMDENLESFQNLKDNLAEYGYDIDSIPTVIQYNKRDLPNAMDISELEKILNKKGFPHFEAVAPTGEGVFKTLKMISKMVLEEIRNNKMGAPNAVKPQPATPEAKPEPKPEPVKAAVTNPESTEMKAQVHTTAPQPETVKKPAAPEASPEPPPEAPLEKPSEGSVQPADTELSESEEKRQVAGIVEDSETLANVVVSDSQNLPNQDDDEGDGDLEETTERAVLREEATLDESGEESSEILSNSDELAKDQSAKESTSEREPIYGNLPDDQGYDDESTQVSDLNLKNPLPLGKPQMAESRKVKNKNKKFSLLGMFKKPKK